jgi:hypothetical protein
VTGQPNDDQESEQQRAKRRQGLAYQGAFEVLLGTGVGFGAFVLRLLRLGRQLNDPDD